MQKRPVVQNSYMRPQTPQSYGPDEITILRVKRKRGQEPLDALVINQHEQQRRKTSYSTGATNMVFSLGETLTETDFNDCQKLQALQDRLAKLSKLPVQESMDMDDDGSQEQQKKTKLKVIGRQPVSMELPKQGEAEKQTSTPGIKGIPQVVAAADLERNKRRFRMYDAVHEEDQEAERSGNKLDKPAEVDDLVPLVRDYLSLGHAVPEYVYDFYYVHQQSLKMEMDPRVLRASNLGMVSWIDDIDDLVDDEESSCLDDDDDDSNAEDYYANDYPDNPDSDAELDEYYYSSDERERLAEDQDLNW